MNLKTRYEHLFEAALADPVVGFRAPTKKDSYDFRLLVSDGMVREASPYHYALTAAGVRYMVARGALTHADGEAYLFAHEPVET